MGGDRLGKRFPRCPFQLARQLNGLGQNQYFYARVVIKEAPDELEQDARLPCTSCHCNDRAGAVTNARHRSIDDFGDSIGLVFTDRVDRPRRGLGWKGCTDPHQLTSTSQVDVNSDHRVIPDGRFLQSLGVGQECVGRQDAICCSVLFERATEFLCDHRRAGWGTREAELRLQDPIPMLVVADDIGPPIASSARKPRPLEPLMDAPTK